MKKVGEVVSDGTAYPIYDSGFVTKHENIPISTIGSIAKLSELEDSPYILGIPSTRLFYASKKKNAEGEFIPIPYLTSIKKFDDFVNDVLSWQQSQDISKFTSTVYQQRKLDAENKDQSFLFYSILQGATLVSNSNEFLKKYIAETLNIDYDLDEILNIFARGGFNEASDYAFALNF